MIPHNMPNNGADEINAVIECLQNNTLTSGEIVGKFEMEFSKYLGMNSIATSSGTHSLHLSLLALGIKCGDEVIIPTLTCPTVALPILYQNAKPQFCDVGDDFNISVEYLETMCVENTKALIVPHMFGYPAKLNEIREFCDDHNIYLVEDCAQSIGAEYNNKKVGTFGDISCFSFYATKMISSIKGGMVCTNDSVILENLNQLIFLDDHKNEDLKNHNNFCSSLNRKLPAIYKYSMSDIEAAFGRVQLNKLDSILSARRKIAKCYINELENCDVTLEDNVRKHAYMRFVIETGQCNSNLVKELTCRQISSTIIHAPLLHQRRLFGTYAHGQIFPNAETKIEKMLSLPIFPSMSADQLDYVITNLNNILK